MITQWLLREGKINAVVAIALLVLVGIFLYLFRLDKQLKSLEEQMKKSS